MTLPSRVHPIQTIKTKAVALLLFCLGRRTSRIRIEEVLPEIGIARIEAALDNSLCSHPAKLAKVQRSYSRTSHIDKF